MLNYRKMFFLICVLSCKSIEKDSTNTGIQAFATNREETTNVVREIYDDFATEKYDEAKLKELIDQFLKMNVFSTSLDSKDPRLALLDVYANNLQQTYRLYSRNLLTQNTRSIKVHSDGLNAENQRVRDFLDNLKNQQFEDSQKLIIDIQFMLAKLFQFESTPESFAYKKILFSNLLENKALNNKLGTLDQTFYNQHFDDLNQRASHLIQIKDQFQSTKLRNELFYKCLMELNELLVLKPNSVKEDRSTYLLDRLLNP